MSQSEVPENRILDLIRDEAWSDVAEGLASRHPADIAEIINNAPAHTHKCVFSLVLDEEKPDVLAELESVAGADILESLSNFELSEIVEDMAPDDAADILGDLSEERSKKVLDLMEKEESEDVRKLLKYEEDTAGGIMTTDVVSMREDQTVGEAIEAIAYMDTHEQFYNANIVDESGRLIGYVDIWDLLREKNRARNLRELVYRDFTAAAVTQDQEEVAHLMGKYDLTVVPVVDREGRLVGRVTADDVIEVLEEEASEDILRLAGSDNAELEGSSVIKSCVLRLPWLLITLVGSVVVALILKRFHAYVSGAMVLVVFVPAILAMGGNTGIQASTLMVRSIALGSTEHRSFVSLLMREILTGALMGCICGLVIALAARFVVLDPAQTTGFTAGHLGATVAIALFSAMTFATMFGAVVPVTLHRLRIDPALASGPFITITNDIAALLIYFAVTAILLHGLQ